MNSVTLPYLTRSGNNAREEASETGWEGREAWRIARGQLQLLSLAKGA